MKSTLDKAKLLHELSDSKLSTSHDFELRVRNDKHVVISERLQREITCNRTGAVFWDCLDGKSTVAQITQELASSYGEATSAISDDVLELASDLLTHGVVEIKDFSMCSSAFRQIVETQRIKIATDDLDRLSIRSSVIDHGSEPPFLTIALACYDDYDGVYFTVQSLRMHHPDVFDEVEIVILDNNPLGVCGKEIRNLASVSRNTRYVPEVTKSGTAVREQLIQNAQGTYVVCMDCHVLIEPGAIKKLIGYFKEYPDSIDLIQGPLVNDSMTSLSTHFKKKWSSGMYGTWASDKQAEDPDAEPFEIPMQGLGLFAFRKAAWPGFNANFYGFGGEEGYIHEKFRQNGGKALCVPFLRWLHRFARPTGIPYAVNWGDRIRNYLIGFAEVGWPTDEMEAHFVNDVVGEETYQRCYQNYLEEFDIDESPTAVNS